MRSAGLQSGDPPAAPSLPPLRSPLGRRRPLRRIPATREGREGGPRCSDLEGAYCSVRARVSLSPHPPQPLRLLSEGCGGKFLPGQRRLSRGWAGLGRAGPACGPLGLSCPARLLSLRRRVGAWAGVGTLGRCTLFTPSWLGGFIFQRRTASGPEPVTRATRLWNWKKNSTLTATSLAAGA